MFCESIKEINREQTFQILALIKCCVIDKNNIGILEIKNVMVVALIVQVVV